MGRNRSKISAIFLGLGASLCLSFLGACAKKTVPVSEDFGSFESNSFESNYTDSFTIAPLLSQVTPDTIGNNRSRRIFQIIENHLTHRNSGHDVHLESHHRDDVPSPPYDSSSYNGRFYNTVFDNNVPILGSDLNTGAPEASVSPPDSLGMGGVPDGSKQKCNDVALNSVYESLLAKNIINNQILNLHISRIFHKIFDGMKNQNIGQHPGSWYDRAIQGWLENRDYSKVLPVTQKQNFASLRSEIEDGHNPALELDFLLYNGKNLDNVGIGTRFNSTRDSFYSSTLVRERGRRKDIFNGTLRRQYGIAKFDVSSLEMPGATPWQHWGRDTCKVDPASSTYNLNVTRLRIPLACGISGTSIIAFWSLAKSKAVLSEDEARLFILSVWASLCADGGHSLQEVMSAAKMTASYFSEENNLRNDVSIETIESLRRATEAFSPLGADENSEKFGYYYDTVFNKINTPGFRSARVHAQEEFIDYFHHEGHCTRE